MNLLSVVINVAHGATPCPIVQPEASYEEKLAQIKQDLKINADGVDTMIRNIIELQGMKDILAPCDWWEKYERIVSNLKFYKRMHHELELEALALISEKEHESP